MKGITGGTFLLGLSLLCRALPAGSPPGGALVESVDPARGTVGTRVTIRGAGFGERRPKVLLEGEAGPTGKPLRGRVRVLSFTDSEISAEIKKARAGRYELAVLPKKGALIPGPVFEIQPPVFDAFLSPGESFPLEVRRSAEVRIRGDLFGPSPKVRVGGKRSKVLQTGAGELVFVVSRKAPPGLQDLEIANKVGKVVVSRALVVLEGDGKGRQLFHEGWERASGSHGPDARIRADMTRWFVGDTVKNFPECGPTPHRAEIVRRDGGKALQLMAGDSRSECADNVWIDSGSILSRKVPIEPGTWISFFVLGELDDPERCPRPGPFQLILPCGDTIHLGLFDDRGNELVYVIERAPGAEPFAKRGYAEVFLSSPDGFHERDLYEDFRLVEGFSRAGGRVSQIVFGVDDHGSAVIDDIRISR